jgi:hypothetical protein
MLRYPLWELAPDGQCVDRRDTLKHETVHEMAKVSFAKLHQGKQDFWGDFRAKDYAPVRMRVHIVQDTSALVFFSVPPRPPQPERLLAAAILLGGFKETDDAAIQEARQISMTNGKLIFTDAAIDAAMKAPRPTALCVCPAPVGLQNSLIRHAAASFAEAFFAQFGIEQELPQ